MDRGRPGSDEGAGEYWFIVEDLRRRALPAKTDGELLGKYRLLGTLGRGGMAEVFVGVATDAPAPKLVAIKVLRDHLAEEPEWVASFVDEARVSLQLNHRNIVQTFEVGEQGGHEAIILELLEGASLSDLRRLAAPDAGGLPLDIGLHILAEALNGLDYAHEKLSIDGEPLGLIHRDFTPNNIMATLDGQVKVLDFGIAKTAETSTRTSTGVVKGTVRFVAPEAVLARDVDRRVDVYAAGITLWELVTGQKAWTGVPDVAILSRVSTGSPPSLAVAVPDAPPGLVALADKALAFDREERFPTASAMRDAIRAYMREAGLTCDAEKLGAFLETHVGASCRERRRSYEAALRGGRSAADRVNVAHGPEGAPSTRTPSPRKRATVGATMRTASDAIPTPSDSTRANSFATSVSTRIDMQAAKAPLAASGVRKWGVPTILAAAGLAAFVALRHRTAPPSAARALPPSAPVNEARIAEGDVAPIRVTTSGNDDAELRLRAGEPHEETIAPRAHPMSSSSVPPPPGPRAPKPHPGPPAAASPTAVKKGAGMASAPPAPSTRPIDEKNPFD
jgi:serine/threonine protein kinase